MIDTIASNCLNKATSSTYTDMESSITNIANIDNKITIFRVIQD